MYVSVCKSTHIISQTAHISTSFVPAGRPACDSPDTDVHTFPCVVSQLASFLCIISRFLADSLITTSLGSVFQSPVEKWYL